MKAHLLCTDCEGLLDKSGENWVLSQLLREDGTFKLGAHLKATRPHAADSETEFYLAREVPQLNVSALAHFGAGIFWRGGLHPWNDDGSTPVKLGPYGESLRRYLLGESTFPHDLALHVLAREGGPATRMMAAPWGGRTGATHMYRFVLPGLAFVLHAGKAIGERAREHCFVSVLASHVDPLSRA